MINDKKHIHFIGICGVAMSALAIAFHKKGYKVTGSDKGFYPPVSTHLKNAGVEYYPGWHVDKMGTPDLVIVGNVAGSTNPEWLHVQENNTPYKSYPEAIAEFFVKENSIVCAGTYGKTTTSTLLTWILKAHDLDPTYMFGGLSNNDMPAAALTDSTYSVLEGDEYKSARWDMRPKFAHYSPTHLLLTAVQWDHADVYPTEETYFSTFKELVTSIPEQGLLVAHEHVKDIATLSHCHIATYGESTDVDYQYTNIRSDKHGLKFDIKHGSSLFTLSSSLLGDYNVDNITGAFAMATELGLDTKKTIQAIASFKGIKRRLEKRLDSDITVIDDIAHSPAKAQSALNTIKKVYSCHPELDSGSIEEKNVDERKMLKHTPGRLSLEINLNSPEVQHDNPKIIAVFEPNSGNRQQESIPGYDDAFASADEVIIPRLTHIKRDPNKPAPLDGKMLTEVIAKTHNNTKHISDDNELVDYIVDNTSEGDVVVFLGSHGFRGMIEELVNKLA